MRRMTRKPGSLSSSRTAPPCRRATACTRLKPRPVPGSRAALLQAHEALQDALAIPAAMPGPWSATAISTAVPRRACSCDRDGRVLGLRRILDGVVDEVGDGLAHELAVGREAGSFGNVEGKLQPTLLRDRLVELGEVAHELARIELLGVLLQHAGFEAGNQQERVEGLDELVRFLDRLARGPRGRRPARAGRMSAASAELRRRMSGVFRSWAMLSETSRRPFISSSMRSSMALRFADSTSNSSPVPTMRDAPRQVAGHDRARGDVDRLDAAQGEPAHDEPDKQARQRQEPERDEVGVAHLVGEAALLLHVAPDDETQAGAELDGDGDRRGALCRRHRGHSGIRRRRAPISGGSWLRLPATLLPAASARK